jgi:hypothetical protein
MPDTEPKAPDDPAGGVGAGGTGATAGKSPPPVIAERPAGTAPSPAPVPAQRNPIFAELVQGEEDLPGLVGYALYKQNKRDWLASFFKTHGRDPTEDEIESYILGERTQRRLATYRRLADELIGRKTATSEKSPEIAAATVAASPQRVSAVKGDSLRSSLPGEAQVSAAAKTAAGKAGKPRRSGAAALIFWILVLLVLVLGAAIYFFPSYSPFLISR